VSTTGNTTRRAPHRPLGVRSRRAVALAALALVAAALWPAQALAREAHLRVIAQDAPVRTGPGGEYRELYRAERGEVFPVLRRGTRGFWLQVQLEDGTTGWIFGELVFPFDVDEDYRPGRLSRMGAAISRALLGPSPAPDARVELSVSGGTLGGEGMFLFRPAVLLDPYFAIEGFAGASPRAQDDLWLAGLGATLRLIPGAPIGPYISAGAGGAHIRPQADNFTEDPRTLMTVTTGAGVEITFKRQITVRLDVRNWTLFDPDEASNAQEFSGGLAIFF
jgi:opacity protein-like surface antigen